MLKKLTALHSGQTQTISTPVPKTWFWVTKLRAGKLGGYQLVHSRVMCVVQKLNFSGIVLTLGLTAKNSKFINYSLVGTARAQCV